MYTYARIYKYTRVQTDRGESNRDDTLSSFEMSKLMAVNKISIRLNDQTEKFDRGRLNFLSVFAIARIIVFTEMSIFSQEFGNLQKSKRLYYLNSLNTFVLSPV